MSRRPYRFTRLPGPDRSTPESRVSYFAVALAEATRRASEATIASERAAWSRLAAALKDRRP